jgi:hypothetical protein
MRKQAKYATPLFPSTSMAVNIIMPTRETVNENTIWKVLSRK